MGDEKEEQKTSHAHIPKLIDGDEKSSRFQEFLKGLFFDLVILFSNSMYEF